MDLSDNVIASPWFVSVPIAIFASLGVLSVSSHKIVSHEPMKSIFIWLGKNTFVILMIHMFAINLSCHYVEPLVSSHFVYKVIEQGLVWTFSVGSAWSISKYARWMLGK